MLGTSSAVVAWGSQRAQPDPEKWTLCGLDTLKALDINRCPTGLKPARSCPLFKETGPGRLSAQG